MNPNFNRLHSQTNRQNTRLEEQVIYDYFLEAVQTNSPEQLIEDFRRLFIEGRGFKKSQVYTAVERIVKSKESEYNFNYFFNRCCHILINRWQMQPQLQGSIPELISIFDNLPPPRNGYHNTPNRLRQLVKNFTQSDHFVKLQRLTRVVNGKGQNSPSVGNLIHRYPYLYNHCLLGDESSEEHQQTVRKIKVQTERRYEVSLSRYVTYKVRMAQMARSKPEQGRRIINPVKNPTLLTDQELNRSLKHYMGTVGNGYTYKSLSHSFSTSTVHTPTFGAYKDELYEYLMAAMSTQKGKSQFNRKIYNLLQNTLPECDHQKPSEFLMLRTASQLLNYLIVESPNNPQHYVFIDLISNMGVTRTVGLLLKVVLICNKVKPYLEKRFSILFNHYEGFTKDGVPWLVKSLENMQLAFSVHFGKVDLSCLSQVKMR
ncbi:MAG: hypothetical protein AB4041_00910 [Microcystaceae cyanobacterium]